jgi:hypothetical protein
MAGTRQKNMRSNGAVIIVAAAAMTTGMVGQQFEIALAQALKRGAIIHLAHGQIDIIRRCQGDGSFNARLLEDLDRYRLEAWR